MAETKPPQIKIRTTREVRFDNGTRWPRGLDVVTTEQELADRGVAKDAYQVIGTIEPEVKRVIKMPKATKPESK